MTTLTAVSSRKGDTHVAPSARDTHVAPAALSAPVPVVFEDGRAALAVKINPVDGFAVLVFLHNAFKKVHRAPGAAVLEKAPAARAQYAPASIELLFPGFAATALNISGRLHMAEHVIRSTFNCCDATINNWRKLRGFPEPHRVHRDNYYPVAAVLHWICAQSMLL